MSSRLCVGLMLLQATNALAQPDSNTSLPASPSIDAQLEVFRKSWSTGGWIPLSRSNRRPYMRKLDDDGWQARMLAFRSLVLQADQSIPRMTAMLSSDSPDDRVLATQVLSFMNPKSLRKSLLDVANTDEDPAARLYAVDALGTLKLHEAKIDWTSFSKNQTNGDVRKHAGYAIQRRGAGVATKTIDTLRDWNPKSMATAKLGQPAPDFELTSAHGETIRLSRFKGAKAVVLVFIYGDT